MSFRYGSIPISEAEKLIRCLGSKPAPTIHPNSLKADGGVGLDHIFHVGVLTQAEPIQEMLHRRRHPARV